MNSELLNEFKDCVIKKEEAYKKLSELKHFLDNYQCLYGVYLDSEESKIAVKRIEDYYNLLSEKNSLLNKKYFLLKRQLREEYKDGVIDLEKSIIRRKKHEKTRNY